MIKVKTDKPIEEAALMVIISLHETSLGLMNQIGNFREVEVQLERELKQLQDVITSGKAHNEKLLLQNRELNQKVSSLEDNIKAHLRQIHAQQAQIEANIRQIDAQKAQINADKPDA